MLIKEGCYLYHFLIQTPGYLYTEIEKKIMKKKSKRGKEKDKERGHRVFWWNKNSNYFSLIKRKLFMEIRMVQKNYFTEKKRRHCLLL